LFFPFPFTHSPFPRLRFPQFFFRFRSRLIRETRQVWPRPGPPPRRRRRFIETNRHLSWLRSKETRRKIRRPGKSLGAQASLPANVVNLLSAVTRVSSLFFLPSSS